MEASSSSVEEKLLPNFMGTPLQNEVGDSNTPVNEPGEALDSDIWTCHPHQIQILKVTTLR